MEGRLDFYDGADGPTFLLRTDAQETLVALRTLLQVLLSGERSAVTLDDLPGLVVTHVDSLCLRVESTRPRLHVRPSGTERVAIDWAYSVEQWEDAVGLLDGLVDGCGSGHQYLTDDCGDDAIVVVSFRE